MPNMIRVQSRRGRPATVGKEAIVRSLRKNPEASFGAIAKLHGVAWVTVQRINKEHNIRLPEKIKELQHKVTPQSVDNAIKRDLRAMPRLTFEQIAQRHNVGLKVVKRVNSQEVGREYHPKTPQTVEDKIVESLKSNPETTFTDIAKLHNVDDATVWRINRKHNVRSTEESRKLSGWGAKRLRSDIVKRIDFLIKNSELSYEQIAGIVGVNAESVRSRNLNYYLRSKKDVDRISSQCQTMANMRRRTLFVDRLTGGLFFTLLPVETVQKVLDLTRAGKNYFQIKSQTGVAQSTIKKIAEHFGLKVKWSVSTSKKYNFFSDIEKAQILESFKPMLEKIAKKFSYSIKGQEAEDLFSETYLACWTALDKYNNPEFVSPNFIRQTAQWRLTAIYNKEKARRKLAPQIEFNDDVLPVKIQKAKKR